MSDPAFRPDRAALRAHAVGAVIALVAALHKMLYASVLVNDDFMHRTFARQLIAGEAPVRDFFDYGMGLMYATSSLAELVFGYRLLSEAIVIGVTVAAATYLVYDVVRRASGSMWVAVLSASLLVVGMPRGYGYPKLIVYAAAAALWWRYVRRPSPGRAIALGIWTGVAFYWRPDHGVYVALGVTLAILAAHGASVTAVTRCLLGGAVTLALVAPWLLYASAQTGGFVQFVQSGVTAASEEHRVGQEVPRWPLRRGSDIVRIDGAESYAPTVGVRWTRDSTPGARRALIERYGLTVVSTRDETSQRVRLSARSLRAMRDFLSEPIVEDTDGIDRGAARVSVATWATTERWHFERWWLRLRLLPGLDQQVEAGQAATILLFAVPLMAVCGAALSKRHLPAGVKASHLAIFGAFALVVDFGLLRTPFHVRVGDAVVLPAIVLGLLTTIFLQASRVSWGWRRWLPRVGTAVLALLMLKSLAVAGQSSERIHWLAGEWTSLDRSRGAREEVVGRLLSSPPIDYWRRRSPEPTLRLAAYARECLPETDRILVLWFAPEIYYYSDRLMATRHVFFLPRLGRLPHETQMESNKVGRARPQIVFTRPRSDGEARKAFPELFDLLAREYRVGGSLDDAEPYLILVRKDRQPVRLYGDERWPCYR